MGDDLELITTASAGETLQITYDNGKDSWGDPIGPKYVYANIGEKKYSIGTYEDYTSSFVVREDITITIEFSPDYHTAQSVHIVNTGTVPITTLNGDISPGSELKLIGLKQSADYYVEYPEDTVPYIDLYSNGVLTGSTNSIDFYKGVDRNYFIYDITSSRMKAEMKLLEIPEISIDDLTLNLDEVKSLGVHGLIEGYNLDFYYDDDKLKITEVDGSYNVEASQTGDFEVFILPIVEGTFFFDNGWEYYEARQVYFDPLTITVHVEEPYFNIVVNSNIEDAEVTIPSNSKANESVSFKVGFNQDRYNAPSITITSSSGTVVPFTSNGTEFTFTMPRSDVMIDIIYSLKEYTVTFYNGETVFDTKSFNHGDTITYPDTNPTRESDDVYHYRFSGWTYKDGTLVSEDATVTGDMDLYAKYNPVPRMYDIYFMDGATVYEHLELPYGAVIEAPDTDPYREGYEFVRWDGYEEGTTVSDDITFEAVFEEVAEPLPPLGLPDDDDAWVPPTIVYEGGGDDDDLWIFVVLGSVALCLFLLFARYERRN